jgi:hypothetical protein
MRLLCLTLTSAVVQYVNCKSSGKHVVPSHDRDTAWSCFLAVVMSCIHVRSLLPAPERARLCIICGYCVPHCGPQDRVLRHANSNSSWENLVHPSSHTVYNNLAVLESCVHVRPLLLTREHPQWCTRLLCSPLWWCCDMSTPIATVGNRWCTHKHFTPFFNTS